MLSLFLELDDLLQHEFQHVSTVGEGSIGGEPDVLFYELNCFPVFEVRDQKLALHLYDLLLTG